MTQPLIDIAKWDELKKAAGTIYSIWGDNPLILGSLIKPDSAVSLVQEYTVLRGKTPSPGGAGAMLNVMGPEMIGVAERAWFQKLAIYGRHLMNAIVGKPINDPGAITDNEMMRLAGTADALVIFAQLEQTVNTVDEIIPSAQGMSSHK